MCNSFRDFYLNCALFILQDYYKKFPSYFPASYQSSNPSQVAYEPFHSGS